MEIESKYLGEGKISKLLLKFSIPCILSLLISSLYNIVDQIFIGNSELGYLGNAATTVVFPITIIAVAFAWCFGDGTAAFLSLSQGRKDTKNVHKAVGNSIVVTIISLVCNIMLAKYGSMSKYGADIPIAVIGIAMKVFTIVINIVVGIVLGAQPILGYNYGSRKFDRVKETFKIVIVSTIIVGLIATFFFEVCPELIIRLFGTESDLYMEFAINTFKIFLMFVTFTCMIKVISIFFQAVGEPTRSAVVSLSRDIVCFVPLVIFLPNVMEINGALWAAPIADIIGIILSWTLTAIFFKKMTVTSSKSEEKEICYTSSRSNY